MEITTIRENVLYLAKECVTKDRQSNYGTPENNFAEIGKMWGLYLGQEAIRPDQVAMMMAILKIVRTKGNPEYADNYIDLAGYAACAAEVAKVK